MMKKYIFILFIMVSLGINAQQITVRGNILSSVDNEPMIGATVMVKGTTNGAVADLDGNYILSNVPADGTISVSMIGYKPQEVEVNNRTVINFIMNEDVEALDEVVVVGYGAVRKSDLTSSISSVKGDDLRSMTAGNAMSSLQGKVNGVQITNGGAPGTIPRVIIRGVTTVNGSNPLYVVDGMP